jgi:hypothetical protein
LLPKRWIVLENPTLEIPQLRSRLEPKLLRQVPLRPAVRLKRSGLSPSAIKSQHQLAQQPLALRMIADEPLELLDELGASTPSDVRLDSFLQHIQPPLLEPPRLGRGERLEQQVG